MIEGAYRVCHAFRSHGRDCRDSSFQNHGVKLRRVLRMPVGYFNQLWSGKMAGPGIKYPQGSATLQLEHLHEQSVVIFAELIASWAGRT